ncbi:MAG: NlpC/P60 family protein [Chlamydiae bacterium]|nr:NlpC/P60 family protein [Chlamydiota bacterium]
MNSTNHLYATANNFTPIFNSHALKSIFGGEDGNSLLLEKGMLRELETVLFPGSTLKILEKKFDHIVLIETEEYSSPYSLYTDSRFLQFHHIQPISRLLFLPPLHKILQKMKNMVGEAYVWGGNCKSIDFMYELYPSKKKWEELGENIQNQWTMRGVDCSGLLYYATEGYTPRNTSQLINYGSNVSVSSPLIPLDLIVWKGHVIVILDENHTIESLGGKGVIITPIKKRIEQIETELLRKRVNNWDENPNIPENHRYIVKRWYPQLLS